MWQSWFMIKSIIRADAVAVVIAPVVRVDAIRANKTNDKRICIVEYDKKPLDDSGGFLIIRFGRQMHMEVKNWKKV